MIDDIRKLPSNKPLIGKDLDKVIDQLKVLNNIRAAGGIRISRNPMGMTIGGGGGGTATSGTNTKIFEVQTRATGNGVYKCRQAILDATNWDDFADGENKYTFASWATAWATGINYKTPKVVTNIGNYYFVASDHLSGTFATDLAAGKLVFIYPWDVATVAWADQGYSVGDMVINGGVHYFCIFPHPTGQEPPDTDFWHVMWQEDDYVWKLYSTSTHFYQCISSHTADTGKHPRAITCWEELFVEEVLNLFESHPIAFEAYDPALALYDVMRAWQVYDDEGNKRWVGTPVVNPVRLAKATENVDAANSITCNLILSNDVEAATMELGNAIEVFFKIAGGTAPNNALPYIGNGQVFFVINERGKWWAAQTLQDTWICI